MAEPEVVLSLIVLDVDGRRRYVDVSVPVGEWERLSPSDFAQRYLEGAIAQLRHEARRA